MHELTKSIDLPDDCASEGFQISAPKLYSQPSTEEAKEKIYSMWELGGRKLSIYFVKYDRTLVLNETQSETLRELNNIQEFNQAYQEDLGLMFDGPKDKASLCYLVNFETEEEISLKTFFKYCLYTSEKKGAIPESYFRKLHLNHFATNKIDEFKTTKEKQLGHEHMDVPRLHHKISSLIIDTTTVKNLKYSDKEMKDYYYQWAANFAKQAILIHYNHYGLFVQLKSESEIKKNLMKSYGNAKFKDPKNTNLEMPSRKADLIKDFYKRFKISSEDIIKTAQKNKKKGVGVRGKTNWGDTERA